MAIEASFTVPRDDFPMGVVFEELADATVELDRVVPTTGAVVPYFWIRADDLRDADAIAASLADDAGISDAHVVDEVDEQLFVRIDWNLDHESVLTAIVDTDVTLLSGVGTGSQWTFEVRASEQRELSEFQTYCRRRDIPIDLTQLHALSRLEGDREYDLTEGQQEALELAYSRGYFDSPREATQDDLADELGISRQAVSSRLQRGMRRILANTLVAPGGRGSGKR